MSITAKSVYRDTRNFFCNQFITILITALLCALITVMLDNAFLPSKEEISSLGKEGIIGNLIPFEIVQHISLEQQKILLHTMVATLFSSLISNTILANCILLIIQFISTEQHISIIQMISASITVFPKLFILIFLTTTLVQIGIMLILLPGVLTAIMLSFAPIILVRDGMSIVSAIRNSTKLVWSNMYLVTPAIINWFLAQTMLLLIAPHHVILTSAINVITINLLSNLISAILLIYLFRLYILIQL